MAIKKVNNMSLKFLNNIKNRFKNRKRINIDEISFEDKSLDTLDIKDLPKKENTTKNTLSQAQKLQQELENIFNRGKMQIETNSIYQIKNFQKVNSTKLAINKDETDDIKKEILEKLNQNPNSKALQELASMFN